MLSVRNFILSGSNGNDNNRGMSNNCHIYIIFSIMGGVVLLFIAAFAMIYFSAMSYPIWCGFGTAILYPGICYMN